MLQIAICTLTKWPILLYFKKELNRNGHFKQLELGALLE